MQEMKFMKKLGYHPHLLSLLGCFSNPEQPILVLEYCQKGDLLKLLRTSKEDLIEVSQRERIVIVMFRAALTRRRR